ncbi:MAG TPA: AgmX/PglI C-terminal domain-containing protein [Kofleriaceae bacterium]|nr:AgmX/PglI C-terminal domain-containing protein [Kofleriaceae bacterium]
MSEDPWGEDSVVAATSELPRPDSIPVGSAVGADADRDDDDNATNRSRDSNRGSRPPAAPTNAHARAAASLGRGTHTVPARPPSDPSTGASSDASSDVSIDDSIDAVLDAVLDAGATTPLPIVETPPPEPVAPPERTSQRRLAVSPPATDHVGRPPLRDSGRRIEKDASTRPSEQRIATERPEEREPLRWPVIILSALVAGGVIILTAIKAKEYTERTDGSTTYVATPPTEPAAPVAAAEPPAAPGAAEPAAATPDPAPAAPAVHSPAVPSPAPTASGSAAPAPVTAAAVTPTPPPIASSPEPVAPSELPARAIAHIEMPADPDNGAADKTPKAVDKAIKPRPRPPARAVKATPARPRPDPEPPPRPERSETRPSESKAEVARAEPPEPKTKPPEPKTKPPEPAPAEPPAARAEGSAAPRPGTIDVAATRAAARTQIGPVQQCYERARMDDPSLSGTVQARITIAPDGTVSRVDIASSTLGAPSVESCIRQAIARWRLPKPSGGVAAALTYPLVFQ